MGLLKPVIVLVLATTAIPVELRPFDVATISLDCSARDMVENLILYVPVGVVLSRLWFWRGVIIAILLSLFAETCQFFEMHRYPSPIDLVLNVAGAIIGLLVSWRWRIHVPKIRVTARTVLAISARGYWWCSGAWLSFCSSAAGLG